MATFLTLINWTDQGIHNIGDSPKRLDAAKKVAKKFGCTFKKSYMTVGAYDMACLIDAPDSASVAKLALSIAKGGNVRTTTLRAFSEETYRAITKAVG